MNPTPINPNVGSNAFPGLGKTQTPTAPAAASQPAQPTDKVLLNAISQVDAAPKAGLSTGQKTAVTGLTIGDFLLYSADVGASASWIHEQGHAVAFRQLLNPEQLTIQIDSFDNLKNFGHHPSGENLGNVFNGHDINNDGAAGVTTASGFRPTPLGKALGPNASAAIVAAAGTLTQEVPNLAGYAAGYMLRNKMPVIGYTLMASAAVNHTLAVLYPLSAAAIPAEQLASEAAGGNDWAQFALSTGIPPLVTGLALAALLPVEAVALHYASKAFDQAAVDRQALNSLVHKGAIKESDLEALYGKYPDKTNLQQAEGRLSTLMNTPLAKADKGTPDQLKTTTAGVSKEFQKFQNYVIEQYRPQIDAEKKQLPKERTKSFGQAMRQVKNYYAAKFAQDKVGTSLEVGTLGGTAAATVAGVAAMGGEALSGASAAAGLMGSVAGTALKALIPGLGIVTGAQGAYGTYKALHDPTLTKTEKALDVVQNVSTMVGAASMLVPAAAPFLMVGGVVGTVGALAAKWMYHKFHH